MTRTVVYAFSVRYFLGNLAYATLNSVDAVLTAWALSNGYGEVREANPAMAFLIAHGGLWTFAGIKVAIGTGMAWYMARKRSRLTWWALALTVGVLAWNVRRLLFP